MNQIRARRFGISPTEATARLVGDRAQERELKFLCLRIVAALPARPEPRSPWDDLARGEERGHHFAHRTVALARSAMRAALATRDDGVIGETRAAIAEYFERAKAAALVDCPEPVDLSATGVFQSVLKETGEGIAALSAAAFERSPSAWTRARREVTEAVQASLAFLRLTTPSETLPTCRPFHVASGRRP